MLAAQTPPAVVVVVRDTAGTAVRDAIVALRVEATNAVTTRRTGADGHVSIPRPPGAATLSVQRLGYFATRRVVPAGDDTVFVVLAQLPARLEAVEVTRPLRLDAQALGHAEIPA